MNAYMETGQRSEVDATGIRKNEPLLRLEKIKSQATVLSEAYRLRLIGLLWWANLMFVVLPAMLAAAAAVLAADKDLPRLWAAGLAGAAAVLTAVHKSLKCDAYQAECLRLGPAYKSIAIKVDSAVASDTDLSSAMLSLTKEYAELAGSAKAMLPDRYVRMAEQI